MDFFWSAIIVLLVYHQNSLAKFIFVLLYCYILLVFIVVIMSVPAGGHLSDEELLKLAPMGPPSQIVTGTADKLSDVGGECCI